MKKFKFKINGNSYDVAVEETEKNVAEVQVNGKTFSVEVEGQEATPVKKTTIPKKAAAKTATATTSSAQSSPKPVAAGNSSNVVKAPIPGSIFKIEVTPGQSVTKGDTLLIMESMKMENSILARKDGIVGAVYVQVGQTVLQGDPLVDLE